MLKVYLAYNVMLCIMWIFCWVPWIPGDSEDFSFNSLTSKESPAKAFGNVRYYPHCIFDMHFSDWLELTVFSFHLFFSMNITEVSWLNFRVCKGWKVTSLIRSTYWIVTRSLSQRMTIKISLRVITTHPINKI